MAKKDDEEKKDEKSAEGGANFSAVKAELVQLENECAGAISINEQGERSQVDQILQTMYRRLKEVNKTV